MMQTTERLELPTDTYRALEQIAAFQGMTLAAMLETWVQQYRTNQNLSALRREYQELTDKDLARTLTPKEEKRLVRICKELDDIEMQSESSRHWQQQADAIDARFDALERAISALPARKTDAT
jgi:uncharacterized coiled-coil DUF342 family protein